MVEGSFPDQEVTMETPLTYFSVSSTLKKKHLEPKASVTSFKRLSFDGRTSLVHCIPKTGRTHQIRFFNLSFFITAIHKTAFDSLC